MKFKFNINDRVAIINTDMTGRIASRTYTEYDIDDKLESFIEYEVEADDGKFYKCDENEIESMNKICKKLIIENKGRVTFKLDEDGGMTKLKIEEVKDDPVNHPSHYVDGKIEVIDFIEDKKLGFHLGNAVKYISRAGKKNPNKKIEDLSKAKWYLVREIERLEKENK